eukprot:3950774-Pyramimonas_sp.AAC.1
MMPFEPHIDCATKIVGLYSALSRNMTAGCESKLGRKIQIFQLAFSHTFASHLLSTGPARTPRQGCSRDICIYARYTEECNADI